MEKVPRPLLVYDGDCSFCRAWIERWRWITGDRVDYAPFQEVAARFPRIPLERFRRSVQLVEPDGLVTEGAEAVFRSLAAEPSRRWLRWLYDEFPLFRSVSEAFYRLVADHRPAFHRITRRVWGSHLVPPGETATCWLFLRVLGAIYAIAFVSLGTQIIGLVGRAGILPAGAFLDAVRQYAGAARFWYAPTLCWLGAGDPVLHALWIAGLGGALLLMVGVTPRLCLIALWALYLSLATVCRDFLWFQWDGLLLETGFLAIFLAPGRLWSRPGGEPAPSRAGLWLLRWLLFRLMFSSAVVKLTSGDPAWRSLTALTHHFETQPLPPWPAWYVHHLPATFHRLSAFLLFAIEGLAPFFTIAPRRIRFAAAMALIALQTLIMVTGNYAFFNLLAIALCLLVLDDGVWPAGLRRHFVPAAPVAPRRLAWPRASVRVAAIALLVMSLVPLLSALRLPPLWLGPVRALYGAIEPFRIVNGYGLFAIMTTRRREIVVEGSADGTRWLAYEFPWKPGDVMRRPRYVAPHQPRLDWQMWFAALSDFRRQPWFLYFCQQLLRGSPPVRALLDHDPFPRTPPRLLRAVVYDYHFSDVATRKRTGAWWTRQPLGLYCPVLALQNDSLIAVPSPGEPSHEPRPR